MGAVGSVVSGCVCVCVCVCVFVRARERVCGDSVRWQVCYMMYLCAVWCDLFCVWMYVCDVKGRMRLRVL